MPAASLRALLTRAIDYAGLFPPASLELEPALRNYSEYIRAPGAWMLGTFILSVAQFDAAARGNSQFGKKHPLRVSALGPGSGNVSGYRGRRTVCTSFIMGSISKNTEKPNQPRR
jgi:hypothetical protein